MSKFTTVTTSAVLGRSFGRYASMRSMLFMGDAGFAAEQPLPQSGVDLHADVRTCGVARLFFDCQHQRPIAA